MNYIELTICVEPEEVGRDILIAELSEIGFESFVETDLGFLAYMQEVNYSKSSMDELFLNYSDSFKINYSEKIIPKQNWNNEWERNFEPIYVADKCYIRAPFHEHKPSYAYEIVIEPKMSFGTGHHFTTQLMIEKMMKLDLRQKQVLDMGCGTGVLAILAAKMGADKITAIDIDEWSYENSIENLQKNGITNVTVFKGDVQIISGNIFFTILANINKNVLLSDISDYVQSLEKKGDLILSGFFETDIDELVEKALSLGLKLEDKKINNTWAMLHFVKK